MTWYPIAHFPPQFVDSSGDPYAGAVLKAYVQSTTTPISMATGIDGSGVASSFALNASGYVTTSGGTIIVPHVQEDFKIALYPDQASADANSGAVWTLDNNQIADSTNTPYFQSFSGDNSTVLFTLSTDFGTDEKTLMVFVKTPNIGLLDKFSGDNSETEFTLTAAQGTDEKAIQVFVDQGVEDIVKNGDFAVDSNWTKGAGWTITGGEAVATGAISTTLTQTPRVPIIEGVTYRVTITTTRTAGSITPKVGGTVGTARTTGNTYTEEILAGAGGNIGFNTAGFTGTVDDVIIVPISSMGMQLVDPDDYTISGDTLTFDTAPITGTDNIFVSVPVASGGGYEITNPDDYTLDGTSLTFDTAPPLGTDNIFVFAPSVLFGSVAASAAAAAVSEANAAASAAAAAQFAGSPEVITASQNAVVNVSYTTNSASLIVVTLPAVAAAGDVVELVGLGSGGWSLAQPAGVTVNFGNTPTTTGVAGSVDSTGQYDAIKVRCVVANTTWVVIASVGNFTVN